MVNFHRKTIYEALGREPVHPFPARMAPGVALELMPETKKPMRVLDPMMGSGTVLAMARSRGHKAIGYDIDPLAVLITRVWTTACNPDVVRERATETLDRARTLFKTLAEGEAYPENADDETRAFMAYWFDGYARRQLTSLSRAIARVRCETTRDVLWCGFSRLIISKQSGASLAMDLSHSRPHRAFKRAPAKPFRKYHATIERILDNVIDQRLVGRGPAPSVHVGDARNLPLEDGSVDLVLTSPPYLNAIDYIRCSKFSLIWMGYSVAQLRKLRTDSIGTEVGTDLAFKDINISRVIQKMNLRYSMTSRNQRILARYIKDMHEAIGEVSRVLSPNGKAVYIIGENTIKGAYIRTAILTSTLAELSGLRLIDKSIRTLPANRRYLPPPMPGQQHGAMHARMRREVVLTFSK
jgi:DNA modification methylase